MKLNFFWIKLNFLWIKADDERLVFRKSALGSVKIIPSVEFLELFLELALKKYRRMHYDSPEKRLDKSWTGYIGEIVVSYTIKKLIPALEFLKAPVLPTEPEALETLIEDLKRKENYYYDEGDLWIKNPSGKSKFIVNVSSRKLSVKDRVENVIKFPQNYVCLIPVDQNSQYTEKSDFCFFCFLIPLQSKMFRIPYQSNLLPVELPILWDWVVPGFLKADDLAFMIRNSYLFRFQRGELFHGLFGGFEVPNYTENFGILTCCLRSLEEFCEFAEQS